MSEKPAGARDSQDTAPWLNSAPILRDSTPVAIRLDDGTEEFYVPLRHKYYQIPYRLESAKFFTVRMMMERVLARSSSESQEQNVTFTWPVAEKEMPYAIFEGFDRSSCGRRIVAGPFGNVNPPSSLSTIVLGERQVAKSVFASLLHDKS